MYIICIKNLISNKWRQVIIPLFESSIIINLNNMYIICIKDLISLRPGVEFPSLGITHARTLAKQKNTAPNNFTQKSLFNEELKTEHVRHGRQLDPNLFTNIRDSRRLATGTPIFILHSAFGNQNNIQGRA